MMTETQIRERLLQHEQNLVLWREPDGLLVPCELDPRHRARIRSDLRVAIDELRAVLGMSPLRPFSDPREEATSCR